MGKICGFILITSLSVLILATPSFGQDKKNNNKINPSYIEAVMSKEYRYKAFLYSGETLEDLKAVFYFKKLEFKKDTDMPSGIVFHNGVTILENEPLVFKEWTWARPPNNGSVPYRIRIIDIKAGKVIVN